MSEQQQSGQAQSGQGQSGQGEDEGGAEPQVVIVGPDGNPIGTVPASVLRGGGSDGDQSEDRDDGEHDGGRTLIDQVEQPAKVMRVGSMVRQLLEEVKAAPLDEASRARLKEIYSSSVKELEQGLSEELVEELERLSLPFAEGTPSESELRVAQAQLVGWLEGLFHGIQTAIYAQQMASRAQAEQIRRALPQGASIPGMQGQQGQPGQGDDQGGRSSGGMYL